MNKKDAIQARLIEITEETQSVLAAQTKEGRDLTPEERKQLQGLTNEYEVLEADLELMNKADDQLNRLAEPQGRRTPPQDPQNQHSGEGMPAAKRGGGGFQTLGHFALAVATASRRGVQDGDQRLKLLYNVSPNSEGSGVDGGFAVPPDFRQDIVQKVMGVDSLVGRTDQLTSSSNTIVMPKDEIAPWQGTNPRAYWEDEAAQIPQSKIALGTDSIRLNKLTSLVPVTEELMEDAPALDAFLRRKIAQAIDYKIQDAIINGNGVGKPLGILNSPALVTVSQEGSQPADTLYAENIMNMWSRMYAPCRSRAVWLYNQDCEPQLMQMSLKIKNMAGAENVGGFPIYVPPGGLSASPYGTLLGRPMVPCESCATVGDIGDIIFADLTQYRTITKAGGMRTDISIHLWFDYDIVAFRVIIRIGGMPWWGAPITAAKSSNSLSCFVVTETR
jgi:HK97 family phage major capsid protein